MKLTKKQIDWVIKEREICERIIKAKPKNPFEYFAQQLRWQFFNDLIGLHNVAVEEEKTNAKLVRDAAIESLKKKND